MKLLETLVCRNKIEVLKIESKFDCCFSIDRLGRGGGLAVFWRSSSLVTLMGFSQNHVGMVIVGPDMFEWRLTGFYGFLGRRRRRESWNLIRALSRRSNLPWVCMGDFNDMLSVEDKWGNTDHPDALIQGFRDAIEDCQLTDIPLEGYPNTWERGRGHSKLGLGKVRQSFQYCFLALSF